MMTKTRGILWIVLGVLLIIPYVGFILLAKSYDRRIEQIHNASFLLIDKEQMCLSIIDYNGVVKHQYEIACGKATGNKKQVGDMKTPEGIFHIEDIQDASSWKHDFKDGKGEIEGAYGPCFIRLNVPGHRGIGIHGTHKPESIGTRDTEGCIRLSNEDILDLRSKVNVGMCVIITPSAEDVVSNINTKQ